MIRIGERMLRTSPSRGPSGVKGVERRKRQAVGLVEVRRIGEVEELGPELHLPVFADLEILEQRKVQVSLAGALQNATAGVTVPAQVRARRYVAGDRAEGGRVEPVPPRGRLEQTPVADPVGAAW